MNQNKDHELAKLGLANVYFQQEKYSTAIIIFEDVDDKSPLSPDNLILLSKALLRNGETAKAIDHYKKSLGLNSSLTDEELDQNLRNKGNASLDVDDLIQSLENDMKQIEKPTINFNHIGGMQKVKSEID
ncbi:MAG: tetratricopeptide repeat protein, partial [Flammeovirgaceae bacterium]